MGMERVESLIAIYRVLREVLGCAVAIILTVLCHRMLLSGTYVMLSVSDSWLLCDVPSFKWCSEYA
jgi:hypothetical protein